MVEQPVEDGGGGLPVDWHESFLPPVVYRQEKLPLFSIRLIFKETRNGFMEAFNSLPKIECPDENCLLSLGHVHREITKGGDAKMENGPAEVSNRLATKNFRNGLQ